MEIMTSMTETRNANRNSKGSEELKVNLKPKLSLLNGVTVIVGSIIGSGIFVSPKGVLEDAGSIGLSLIIWTLCGLYSMVGAYCYAELGTSILRSGADYAYIYEAFGPFLAFLRLWVECMIVRPCTQAIVALTFSYYVIEPLFPTCEQPESAVRLLAVVAIVILTFINCYSVRWTTRVQDIFTYAKVIALILIIATGFVMIGYGETENFARPFEHTETRITNVALSFYSGLFAYNGWNYLNFITEELKNPHKNLPKAIWMSVTLVTFVYVLANVAYLTLLSREEILSGAAVAVMFAKRIYGRFWIVMPIFVALSTFGGVNGIILTTSRLFFVGAREGHMPQLLSMVQIHRLTPMPSVIFMSSISLLYLISSDLYALITYVSFVNWMAIGISVAVLLYFRKTRPNLNRPIKVCLVWPILYVTVTVFLILLPVFASPRETGFGMLIIASGIPFYVVCVAWKRKTPTSIIGKITLMLQKIMMVVPEEGREDITKSI